MALQAEILNATPTTLSVVYWFEISTKDVLVFAVRPNVDPQTTKMTPQEKQDFKDGKIHEILESLKMPKNTSLGAVENLISARYDQLKLEARDDYNRKFNFNVLVGKTLDAGGWN